MLEMSREVMVQYDILWSNRYETRTTSKSLINISFSTGRRKNNTEVVGVKAIGMNWRMVPWMSEGLCGERTWNNVVERDYECVRGGMRVRWNGWMKQQKRSC